jgi:hypothetical protein
MCENAINLSTSTIKHMRGVMWPFLFEFIIPKQYENSLNVVCKSLGTLAETLRDEDDEIYDLDYDVQVNKQTNKQKQKQKHQDKQTSSRMGLVVLILHQRFLLDFA